MQDNTSLCEALQQMAIFGGVDDNALHFLLARSRTGEYAAGSHITREGETGTGLFVLLNGRVAVQRRWDDHEVLLRELDAGECFGEMALLDLGKRSASVLALQDCRVLEMETGLLHDFFEHDTRQFALMQMNIARELSRRLRATFNSLFRAATTSERELIERLLRQQG
ncbi:cyclic nucleotide-binding domain-containing protein [Variovorax soli]|jgi:CRP-like cAMP-binding protein|uniref:cyclic nucleotide-binding domain-containing protein n=1 Tax=Variovorax soli TaxID=376815 RepID=UPI0008386DC1|nr:cyclic nucleotide-binding domain-containing protein [Variovorax soli]